MVQKVEKTPKSVLTGFSKTKLQCGEGSMSRSERELLRWAWQWRAENERRWFELMALIEVNMEAGQALRRRLRGRRK